MAWLNSGHKRNRRIGIHNSDSDMNAIRQSTIRKLTTKKVNSKKSEITSLTGMRKREEYLVGLIVTSTGMDYDLANNVLCYAESLVPPNMEEHVDRPIFTAEMAKTFKLRNLQTIERIYYLFAGKQNLMTTRQFVKGISIFVRGRFNRMADLVFDIYDTSGNGQITYHDIYKHVKYSTDQLTISTEEETEDVTEELLRELSQQLVAIMKQESINKFEYRHMLQDYPLMYELMQECLPPKHCVQAFVDTIDPEKYTPAQCRQKFRCRRQELLSGSRAGQRPPTLFEKIYPVVLYIPSTKEEKKHILMSQYS